jgi:hypothetical protein
MKVYIGKHINFVGPYQIAKRICFWEKEEDHFSEIEPFSYKLGTWLAEDKNGNDTFLAKLCNWIHEKRKRKISVKIHNYDSWNADHTLSLIIVPILKQLKENKHGYPYVDEEDAPHISKEEERWDYALDEMIWAFSQHHGDYERQFYSGKSDWYIENGMFKEGPNNTFQIDKEGLEKHRNRMLKGRMLFAKYYEALWD